MTNPIETIRIYNPAGLAYYSDAAKTNIEFPVTNSCERSAKLMGDDYVRLVFKLPNRVVFDTYAFIEYDGQTFFLKETYRPTPNGCLKETIDGKESVSSAYYSYDVKFVSIANMLTKPICYRHVVVKGAGGTQQTWDEPEISINGTLETLYQIIIGSIQQAASRLSASHYKDMLTSIATNGAFTNGAKPNGVQLTPNTKLVTFSFSGDNIANVCTSVANAYSEDGKDTEWYITEDAKHSCTLHFAKCESADTAQVLSDYEWENNGTDRFARPYLNGGLKSVEYAQAWSDVPQVIVPYGADRNMSGISVVGIDETTQMQSTFGKRLRLDPNTTYNVHDKNGENAATITTDAHGAISNPNENTGIEVTKFYNDIYPQCHFKIIKVEVKNKRQNGETVPEYTCEGIAVDARYTKEYLAQKGMFPLRIEEATTLSVRFESGFLNGREFEIANKTHKDQGSTGYSLKFTIVADGSIEDGTLIPSGNFKPNVGDQFALFNMKMPAEFVSLAKQDLAQRAYEELLDLQNTRPEVKCTAEPFTFMQHTVSFGAVMQVSSELFGDKPFGSRVISYSYKLTSPSSVQFSLASAVMQGTLSEMNNAISDVTHTAGGLEQRAINLSRRGWRDANEVADMLDSITSEMMLVGNERYQFGFTSAIECVDSGNKFTSLRIGYGSLQHTQEPYINYANRGLWEISGATLTKDVNGADLDPNTPYYLFAQVADDTNPARLILTTDAHSSESEDDVPYLLLGILSSEFEDRRVFSRTNGYTAIEGGTITTEQIQDASRNLIIDFQSNPPRIIARNGAEIIGNVRFKASDTKTAEEQLRDLGIDANNAQSTADDAKSVADAATTRLNNWAADGVISPVEKQGIKDEIARIDADKSQITAEYTKYGLGTPTAFNTAHTNYRAVLVTLSANNPENIAIPADFSTKQTAYYTARTTALNAISTKADEVANAYADKVSASAAKAALDNLQIGGRNLVLNSDGSSTANIFAYGDCYAARVVKDYDGGTGNEIYIGKSKQPDAGYTYAQSVWIRAKSNFELDTDYVLSFDARLLSSSGFTSIPVYLRLAGTAYGTSVMKKVEVTKDLKRVSVVLHSHPTDPYNYGTLFIGVPTTIIYISKVKLEKGNKATDWTPAPEDVEASIAENKTYADGLVKALGDNLQNQIDGVVDSYFLEGKPTNSNYPANEWTTDELKKRHEGDTYTDITEYIDNETTPTAGHSWRWCRGSSDNPATTWHWHEIADSDAVRALQNAAKAQDTADGKRRVFVVQPTPPYEVGDLWAQGDGEGKDILKCKTARAAGQTFAQADWEAASSALRTAGSAQEAAEEAKKTLANIASDSVFTKQEKCAVRTEWASIQAEFTKNTNNAKVCWGESGYGNNTEYKAYSTAYTALNNYLTNTAKLSVNEDTEIKPDEFNKAFSDYYGANVTLLNAIAKRVSELEAAAAIDNLEVGGENLYTGDNPLTIAANNSNYNNQVFTCKLQNGEQYVFSCGKSVVKSGNTDKYTILLYDDTVTPNAGFGYWKLPVSATKVEKTFVVPNSGNWQIRLYAGEFHYTAGVSIEFTDIMVQKGNKATEYQKPIRKFLYNGNVSIPYKNTDYAQSKLLASGVYAGTYYTEMASESKGAGVTTANRDAFMNSCLVWFVAGKPQTTENVLKITDWGEAVNISQRADVYVYTGQAAFVKSHIQDPTSTRIEFTANGTWTISGAQISTYKMEYLEGETYEAKTKAEALDYLKAAMANGSTKVAGGLLMTNVLMLRDLANNVTAGLSGLTKYKPSGSSTTLEDLVLLWGGATYDEAFYAARNAGYLKKAGGDPITTLLKKDGTGKIGIFKISDTQAVIDVPNQGKVIIDASTANGGIFIKDSGGIDRVVISPLSLNSFGLASTHDLGKASILKTVNDTQDKDLSGTVSYSKSFVAGKTGTLESSFSIVTEINASVMINSGKGYPSATAGYNTLYVTIKDTTSRTTVFTQSLSTLSVTASANNTTTSNISDSKYDGKIYPVSIKIQVVKGHNYTFSISGTAIVRGNIGGTSSGYDAEVHASLSITSQSNIKLLYTDMCAYLCVDGMSVAANSELKFDVMKSGTDLKVLAQGLPTTTSGLSAGQIYKDSSGILRIWGR